MNYYEHHLGDYLRDTAHLSMLEDGAYRRLLDAYYIREAPLPLTMREVFRLVRAQTKQDREAVETVLREFFTETPDGWRHGRCDREIESYQDKVPDREAKRENNRERQRRARERRKVLFEALRGHDIVPPFDATTAELERLLSRATVTPGNAHVTQPVTRDNTATQTPDTRHQTPDINPPPATSTVVGEGGFDGGSLPSPSPYAAVCVVLRSLGLAIVNPANPTLRTLVDAGATPDEFAAHVPKAIGKRDPFSYVLGCVEGERKRAAETAAAVHRGPMPSNGSGAPEPEWVRERRETVAAYAGPFAAKRPADAPKTTTGEVIDVTARRLG